MRTVDRQEITIDQVQGGVGDPMIDVLREYLPKAFSLIERVTAVLLIVNGVARFVEVAVVARVPVVTPTSPVLGVG